MPDEVKPVLTFMQSTNFPEFSPTTENWTTWRERFNVHLLEIECTTENKKKALLLRSIGTEAYNVLHCICDPQTPAQLSYENICKILTDQFTPPTIVFFERKQFHNAIKREEESISAWYARVKKLALTCKFASNLDAFVLNQFIMGLPSIIFDKICEENETLTLPQALTKAMLFESKMINRAEIAATNEINYVNKKKTIARSNGNKNNSGNNKKNDHVNVKATPNQTCSRCGWKNHTSQQCKHINSKCHCCGKTGHLASVCRNKFKNTFNYISETSNNLFPNSVFSISGESVNSVYMLPVVINGQGYNIACDTGAPCTLVSTSFYNKIKCNNFLQKCETPYVSYNGDHIKILGEFNAVVNYEGNTKKIKIIVTNSNNPPLLGRNFLRAFNFELKQVNQIKVKEAGNENKLTTLVNEIKNEFKTIFEPGLGMLKGEKVSLTLKAGATPKFFKPRPLPLGWRAMIEKQLNNLIEMGVLEQVDNSDWGTPLVPVLKPNGDIRICADYKVTLNTHLTDFKYPLPRIEEIFTMLQGGTLFSKLDMSNAYNQLVLDEDSQNICSWSTHLGILKMKRLPFGIKTAAAIFQKTMENLLRGFSYVVVYQDDIVVTGKNLNEHIDTLKKVLNKLQSCGLKLNVDKCKFFQTEVSYLGFTISQNGLKKNNDRILSVLNAPKPDNVSSVKAFIGMTNYYSKFIENFAEKTAPLYNLLRKGIKFHWSRECQQSYDCLKKEMTSDKVLTHFNPDLPIILTTDASNNAVAGVLSHRFPDGCLKPIAYVSRALNKSEKNYSTLDKEALAIIFCVTKLKEYLIGNNFILRTDHKPLVSIFGERKGIPIMAAARMQRWAVILSGFNYTVEYVKGNQNIADGLSRLQQSETVFNADTCGYVHFIRSVNHLNLNFNDISRETRRDPLLSKICEAVQKGSLSKLSSEEYVAFRNRENELSVEHGCLLWGYRTVVPQKLREKVLNELHSSHMGIVKTKAMARSFVWWPKIDQDIEKLIKTCKSCQKLLPSPEKTVLIPWTPTDVVWSRIHIDFAGPINNFYLLIVIDSLSKWVEVFLTKQITSEFVINKLNELFCRYGLVDTIVSDNGRQFTSSEFQNFLKNYHIKHILTAPGHPATNGQAENFIKTLKKSIYANLQSNANKKLEIIINRFLFDYRNTMHATTSETPAKLFFNRSLKTRFSLLQPPLIKDRIKEKQSKSVINFRGKRNTKFEVGQRVLVRNYTNPNKQSWDQATIKQPLGTRSYLCILSGNNRELKRHTNQIRNNEVSNDETNMQSALRNNEEPSTVNESEVLNEVPDPPVAVNLETNSPLSARALRPRIDGKVVYNK